MKVLFWIVIVVLVFDFTTAFLNGITNRANVKHRYIDLATGGVIFVLFIVLVVVFDYVEVI